MFFLYLDDSGSASNKNERYFVLGGVCVPENSIYWLSNNLEKLATKISPENARNIEFHASEIFSAKKEPWKRFKNKQGRTNIIKDVLRVLDDANADIVTFACAIHKDSFPAKDPVELAFEDLCSRFSMYLNRKHHDRSYNSPIAKGLIIFDECTYENTLQKMMRKFQQTGTRWGALLKDIVEVPLFVDSKASRLIQLADHIAYAVFRRYNAGDLNYYNCIESRFDTDSGVIHGLVHKQNYLTNCTCPACLSRK